VAEWLNAADDCSAMDVPLTVSCGVIDGYFNLGKTAD